MLISILGGGGRVGLPLGISLANNGHKVTIVDIDDSRVQKINNRIMPFSEPFADEMLLKLSKDQLIATSDYEAIKGTKVCILIVGTPVDSEGIPSAKYLIDMLIPLKQYLVDVKLLMLRSTVYPGITQEIESYFSTEIPELLVSFCPERIAEGKAMEEIRSLPQLVGASSEKAYDLSCEVFKNIAPKTIKLTFSEAEISKLFANSYRYLKFGIANEFFKICIENNIDWLKVWQSLREDYPRAKDLPMPGFSAGPCLVKDTQQLKYFSTNGFLLGTSALEINENLPNFIINFLESKYELKNMVVGILGMTFKGDVDDFRSSLSFKLKNILEAKSRKVYCSDDLMQKNYFIEMEELIDLSDLLILATPHTKYKGLKTNKPLVDIWRISETKSII